MRSARSTGEAPKAPKKQWTVCEIGDLVEVDDSYFTVINKRSDGWFELLGPAGRRWAKGTKIQRIQKTSKPVQK
jgi:hypothetical protein